MAAKERNSSKNTIRVVSNELEVQRKTWLATGSASTCFEVLSLEGEKQSLEKGDTNGSDNTTCGWTACW